VGAVQLESRMAAVIEFRRPPRQDRVAARAGILIARRVELSIMHVGVAGGAILGRAAEGDRARDLGRLDGRFVTRQAIHGRVSAHKREGGLAMIETAAVFPGSQ